MASELLKNKALMQKLRAPNIPVVDFGLNETNVEFILPEEKPEELLEIQEQAATERRQETMDKARPFLMDESVDFIEREEFSKGGSAALAKILNELPDGTEVTRDMVQKIIDDNNLDVTVRNFFARPSKILKEGITLSKRMPPLKITDELLEKVDNYIKNTPLDLKQIGEDLGYKETEKGKSGGLRKTSPLIKAYEEKYGEIPDGRFKPYKLIEESDYVQNIIKLREELKSTNAVAKELKLDSKTIRNVLSQFRPDLMGEVNVPGPETGAKKIKKRAKEIVKEGEKKAGPKTTKQARQVKADIADRNKIYKNMSAQELAKDKNFLNRLRLTINGRTGAVDFTGYTEANPVRGKVFNDVELAQHAINKAKEGKLITHDHITPKRFRTQNIQYPINFQPVTYMENSQFENARTYLTENPDGKVSPIDSYLKLNNKTIRFKIDNNRYKYGYKGNIEFNPETGNQTLLDFEKNPGERKLTAFQKLINRKGSGVDPVLALKAGKEEFLDPALRTGGKILRGAGTAADFAISAGKGATGLGIGLLLEADPIITGMSEGKDFGQTARDTFVGTAIDAIPGVNLGSLNEDLIELADTEEQKVAIQNLIDYQKDYDRFTKDLRAFKSYRGLDQVSLEELGFTATDLVNMENQLAKRFEDIQTRAPEVYKPEVMSIARELAKKEAIKRKENLEGIQGLIFGDRMAKDPNFIENQIQQILAASTGVEGATDSYADNYKFLPPPEVSPEELDDIYEMGGITGAAEGGRIGFADGPLDPKRRLFLKIMGGIAALPIFSKFLGKSEVAKPIVKIANSSTKMPDWFPDLINKAMFGGTGKKIDADLTLYEPKELPGIEIYRHDDGRVFVEGTNEYGKSYKIEYEPPGYELIDEKTGKAVKREGEFIAQEEVPVNVDPDGNADFDVEVLDDLDQILGSDTRAMEEFATGRKIKDMKQGEFQVGKAEADAERFLEEAELLDEID